ncbi:MAG: UDP-N-acetylmuramoyl-L-alanine--D-glutamate ligase, partial [Myxococcota bacterium]
MSDIERSAIERRLQAGPVVVVGFGVSGEAAVRLLLHVAEDAEVRVNDGRPRDAFDGEIVAHFEGQGVRFFFGGHTDAVFEGAGTVVLSPGVPSLEAVERARSAGAEVIGEIELALRYVRGPVVAVTGTNGKSTVVGLLSAMAWAARLPHFLGGNFGIPLSEGVRAMADVGGEGLYILELSSFQLETVRGLGAKVAAILNITEDHADRYEDFAAYGAAKARIFAKADRCVVPASDPVVKGFIDAGAAAGAAGVHRFGAGGEVFAEGDELVDATSGQRIARTSLRLVGAHNALNACAAMLIACLAGLSENAIAQGIADFEGLPHRMALVGDVKGVAFIDDSKATNVGAAVASIRSLGGRPFVLIAGGRDKDGDLSELREAASNARAVVLLGEAAARFADALSGSVPLKRVDSLEAAVTGAVERAEAGDPVQLAPACSSYDIV